jgi:hypothetical protein
MITKHIQTIAMKELYNQNMDGFLPVLVEIYNPDLVWDGLDGMSDGYLRLINDTEDVVYKGIKYIKSNITFSLPETDGKSVGNGSVSICDVDHRVTLILRSIELKCTIKLIAVFARWEGESTSKKLCFYPLSNYKFIMETATYNGKTATFPLIAYKPLSLNVPRDSATRDMFPSVAD